jgi:hypothetical protein
MIVDNFMQVMTARRIGKSYYRELDGTNKRFTLHNARDYIIAKMAKTQTGGVHFGSR